MLQWEGLSDRVARFYIASLQDAKVQLDVEIENAGILELCELSMRLNMLYPGNKVWAITLGR